MAASKSPAFQFYPQDYLASTRVAEMTLEEEGVYIRLLCYCWASGSIPADPERCARLAGKGCSAQTATTVQRAFNEHPTDNTKLVHNRIEIERENQRLRREQASEAGKKSAEARSKRSKKPANERPLNDRSTNVQRKVNTSSSSSSSSSSVLATSGEPRKPEHIIPKKLDDAECHEAAERWFAYMKSSGLEDKSPDGNEISLQEWWRLMARMTRDNFISAVTESIAARRWNVTKNRTDGSGNSKSNGTYPDDLLKICTVCQQYPKDIPRRKELLGPKLFEIGKRLGIHNVLEAAGNDWKMKGLSQFYAQHLKDLGEAT